MRQSRIITTTAPSTRRRRRQSSTTAVVSRLTILINICRLTLLLVLVSLLFFLPSTTTAFSVSAPLQRISSMATTVQRHAYYASPPQSSSIILRRKATLHYASSSSSSSSSSVEEKEEVIINVTDVTPSTISSVVEKDTDPSSSTDGLQTSSSSSSSSSEEEEEDVPFSLRTKLKDTLFLGIDPTPDIIAIASIYFVEGALGLARLAETFLLKDELHLGPAELSALSGLFVLPWTIKPLYGFLSDGVPLFGYRRRSYLIVAGLLGCFTYTALGHDFWGLLSSASVGTGSASVGTGSDITTTTDSLMIQATIAALVLASACIAFSDVVADGIVVQKTRESAIRGDTAMAGGLQSICWGSAACGALLSAYYSGSLLEVMKPQEVFQLTAVLPLIVAGIAFLIDEKPVGRKSSSTSTSKKVNNGDSDSDTALAATNDDEATAPDIQSQISALWGAIRQPSIWKPTLFLFLWQSTPTSDGAFLFFMTDELGFGPEFLGRVRLVTAGAGLLGVIIYNRFLKTVAIKDILFWSSIIATPLGLSSLLLITHANRGLGIPDAAFVFGDDVALAILGQIAFMPTLVLAARLCPPGVEAVLFATLMSIYNFSGTVGTEIGAGLTKYLGVTETNFDNLGLLTLICNLSSLYPLVFIGWLDEVGSTSESEDDEENGATLQLSQEENGSNNGSSE